ncbi:acyl-CoA synthetase FdrA [Enterococcus sp. LJL98]
MNLVVKTIPNRYIDSVSLMALSTKANQIDGIDQIILAMATDMNKEVMKNVGLFNEQVEKALSSDLLIVMKVKETKDEAAILTAVEGLLDKKEKVDFQTGPHLSKTIHEAHAHDDTTNFAFISVNGHFAAREAQQALDNHLHVMLFSDNVSVEDEIHLKDQGLAKGLLVMGPDCGTAIINHIGLGFANHVRPGNIGVIGASGTGSQEIAVRIHEFGGGISQLLGVGGRDLSEAVGGRMMLASMQLLEEDPQTAVIVLVSKTPAPRVEAKIIEQAKEMSKPVVVWFVGDMQNRVEENVHFVDLSKNAALKAVALAGIDTNQLDVHPLNLPLIAEVQQKLTGEQKYIRGLFTGGTLCSEAYFIAKEKYTNVYSNTTDDLMPDLSQMHTFIDYGADEYTDGKPHPMIDPSNRIEGFKQVAQDPSVGVILLDFVLGYGAHPDPVGAMVPAMMEAKEAAEKAGRHLEIIGYVLGTPLDEQNLQEQLAKLESTGATYASSMQNAGLLAREFVEKGE